MMRPRSLAVLLLASLVGLACGSSGPDDADVPATVQQAVKTLDTLVPQATIVLDCTDNYKTRQTINAACVRHDTPLIEGAAIRVDGQLMVIDPTDPDSPCYACIFPPEAEFEEVQCSTMGVFAPLVGLIGIQQAAEALKLIVGFGRSSVGRLQMLDARSMEWSTMHITRSKECVVCSNRHTFYKT